LYSTRVQEQEEIYAEVSYVGSIDNEYFHDRHSETAPGCNQEFQEEEGRQTGDPAAPCVQNGTHTVSLLKYLPTTSRPMPLNYDIFVVAARKFFLERPRP
jgi:hypothetical protein